MPSSFGWLDADDEQRRRMIEVVDLFREQGTVDELGIGAIRDTFSDVLFPGTSTLHTRLRYALFLPWLLEHAVARKDSAAQMSAEFRALEYRLIDSLLAGGEREGVMGNVARARLKRLPSIAYWSALGRWGVVQASSSEAYFRRQVDVQRLARRSAVADDEDSRQAVPAVGTDPHLPSAPADLFTSATFALSTEEESYLSQRIATSAQGSLLAWLIANPPNTASLGTAGSDATYPWDIANLGDLPAELASVVENARIFSLMVNGAALVYNASLARLGGRDELAERHEAAVLQWQQDERPAEQARTWDTAHLWEFVSQHNSRLNPLTRDFVARWVDLVRAGDPLVGNTAATTLVANRERLIKGSRARFVNQAALDRWSGSSGLGRLDFRWNIARAHLGDIYRAREVA